MNKCFFSLSFSFLILNSVVSAYDITEQQDTPRKELHERRLQNRLFKERRASEMPYTRDAEIIQEKKEKQGWYNDDLADANQNRANAVKRQQQEVQSKELEQKRIQNKVIQQQLENRRLDDARYQRKLDDAAWDRSHRR